MNPVEIAATVIAVLLGIGSVGLAAIFISSQRAYERKRMQHEEQWEQVQRRLQRDDEQRG